MKTAHDITEPVDIARHIIRNTGRDAVVLEQAFPEYNRAMVTEVVGDHDTMTKLVSIDRLRVWQDSPGIVVVEA